MLRHIRLLAILIEMVYLYTWASGATAIFAGMPSKLKFYQKKSAERLQKLRKLIVDNYVMRNADSSPFRRRFLSLYADIISMVQLCTDVCTKCGIKWNVNARLLLYDEY